MAPAILEPRLSQGRTARKAMGLCAVLFGLCGVILPIALAIDAGGAGRQISDIRLALAPLVISLCAHSYLIVAGVALLRQHRARFLGVVLAIETLYALGFLVALPFGLALGFLGADDARWYIGTSVGFVIQILVGFPLWGWLLIPSTRREGVSEGGSEGGSQSIVS